MELDRWEPGVPGRGILVDSDASEPALVLWTVDESGGPLADDVIRHLGLTSQIVFRFDLDADGHVRWLGVATAGRQPSAKPDARRVMSVLAGLDRRLGRDVEWEELLDDPDVWAE